MEGIPISVMKNLPGNIWSIADKNIRDKVKDLPNFRTKPKKNK